MIFLYPFCEFEPLCVSQGKQKGFIGMKGYHKVSETPRRNNSDGWNQAGIVKMLDDDNSNENNIGNYSNYYEQYV